MYKYSNTFALVLFAALLFIGCDKDDKTNTVNVGSSVTDIDLEKVMRSPYSTLTPNEQKAKLEQESIDFLNELKAAGSLQAIEVFDYFINDLLYWDEPEIDDPMEDASTRTTEKWLFDITNSYGVFTWDASKKEWTKTNSNSELKFVFPSDSKSKSNNATLSLKALNSGATITEKWEDYYYDESYETIINLPNYASAILSIDGKEKAKIEVGAEYKTMDKIVFEDDDEYYEAISGSYPVKTQLKITTSEGFVYWYSVDGSGKDSRVEMQLTKEKQILVETLFSMDIDFKKVLDEVADDVENLLDLDKANANGYMKLMDDLVIIYQIDAANMAREIDKIESEYDKNYPNWSSSNYYTLLGQLEKKYSDDMEKAVTKYMQVGLFSITENYKIADLILRSEKVDEYWDNYRWNDAYGYWEWSWSNPYVKLYDEYGGVPYLKFRDNTLVEAEAYFSSGFGKLESTWKDFIEAFDR